MSRTSTLGRTRALLIQLVLLFSASVASANLACPALFGDAEAQLAMQPIERIGYNHPLFPVVQKIVRMRYDIEVRGMSAIESRGRRGILFAMNHPSFSDPAVVTVALQSFHVAPVMSQHVVDMPVIGRVIGYGTDKVNAIYVPVRGSGVNRAEHVAQINALIQETIVRLQRGENVVLWPAGELMHENRSNLGQKRMLAEIVKAIPELRVVLGRTTGMWGSALGWGATGKLSLGRGVMKAAESTVSRALTGPLTPRRKLVLELYEPSDLPRSGDRNELNRFVESWFNLVPDPKTRVAYNPVERVMKGAERVEPDQAPSVAK